MRAVVDAAFIAESPEAVGIDSARVQALLQRAEREVREGLLPAAQVAIAREGRIAALRTFGEVRHEGRETPATNDTLFCVFSASKAITSSAAWLLIQEGKLDPNELVADIVPEFSENGKGAVRVEHLLTHTAGFPHAPFPPLAFRDPAARRKRFARWRLKWEPGTRFEYHPSSSMYVAADIIEQRSGMMFADFVRERIAEPLGLPDLRMGLPRALHHRLADVVHVGNEPTDDDYAKMGVPKPPASMVSEEAVDSFNRPEIREVGIPGGGGTTNAASIALFYQALLHGGARGGTRLWTDDMLRDAQRVRTEGLIDPGLKTPASRGLGIIISGDETRHVRSFGRTNSPSAFGHGGMGGQLGWADPETGISFAYATCGHDRNPLRRGRRGVGLSSRAAICRVGDPRPAR
jgi:CubicO group peptidase (beta-lactamase class C family)